MRFGILFVHKVRIIGADELYAMLASKFYKGGFNSLLLFKNFSVGFLHGVFHLMPHQFNIEVFTKYAFEPFDGLFSFFYLSILYVPWNLTGKTSRGCDDSFMMFLNRVMICSWAVIIAINPCFTYDFDKIVITDFIFC